MSISKVDMYGGINLCSCRHRRQTSRGVYVVFNSRSMLTTCVDTSWISFFALMIQTVRNVLFLHHNTDTFFFPLAACLPKMRVVFRSVRYRCRTALLAGGVTNVAQIVLCVSANAESTRPLPLDAGT